MQIPQDLSDEQLGLLSRYWGYQSKVTDDSGNEVDNPQSLDDLVESKKIDWLNNIFVEQANRDALAAVTTPTLLQTNQGDN